jgi:DNA-binding NarL/FixJ family response regulator/signal transduction histidine kinase
VFLLAAMAGLSIIFRRRSPMLALVLMTIATGLATAFGENWAIDPFVALPIYLVASTYELRRSITTFAVSTAALIVASAGAALSHRPAGAGVIGIVLAGWCIGESVRVRRTYMAGIAEQAAQRQREVVDRAERSIAEERLQVARELHDVVAHSLSVIAVQSGVGHHVIDDQPEEAKKALAAIETTSRSALDELRRMLGVLRRDDQAAPLEPAHGLSALEALVQQVRAAGFNVELDIRYVTAGTLSPAAELSTYRIVQEALTNVVKHAGSPADVRVEIRRNPPRHRWHARTCRPVRRLTLGRAATGGRLPGARPPAPRRSPAVVISVVVVDDQALVRAGFRVLVDSSSDLEVLGEAADGMEAVRVVHQLRPDVVLMDIRMPGMDGIEATRQIVGAPEGDGTRVLILTTFDLDQYVYDALRAGASGFLLKDTPPDDLLEAIRVIAAGNALLAPSVTRTLIAEFASRAAPLLKSVDALELITPREREVLLLIARGRSNSEVAEELHMSSATAKTHVSRLLSKLGARDRAQLVVIAYESGLMTGQ